MPRPIAHLRRALVRAGVGALVGLLAAAALTLISGSGQPALGEDAMTGSALRAENVAKNVATPGSFTGYGFDQCLAPEQWKMDRWLQSSPFLAIGVYISGKSRACRHQPNLTRTWVRAQLSKGWRLLPITVGPQASCQPRFPRYHHDRSINPRASANGRYPKARKQGRVEAGSAVAAAGALGIAHRSTLWYDLEGFDSGNTACRESALAFLSGWSTQIRKLGYVSGVYSSAGSGILQLDNARVNRPGLYAMPDQIWVARWDGIANTSTSYLRRDGWHPHARVKQYQGGHDERWGGVRINIDRNFLDVGRGSFAAPEQHCGGVTISLHDYDKLKRATSARTSPPAKVKALQCLLKEHGLYHGKISGKYGKHTIAAAKAWQSRKGVSVRATWTTKNWMSLLVAGARPVLKLGSAGPAVRRVQRALNATGRLAKPLRPTGVFDAATSASLRAWQHRIGVEVTGVAGSDTWPALSAGRR